MTRRVGSALPRRRIRFDPRSVAVAGLTDTEFGWHVELASRPTGIPALAAPLAVSEGAGDLAGASAEQYTGRGPAGSFRPSEP